MARCTAHSATGKPCKAWAIHGGTVCVSHGGAAPQVKRKAAERLEEVRDDALSALGICIKDDGVDAKTLLDATVKLTELVETLQGRVARREEQRQTVYSDLSDEELERAIVREAERITRGAGETPGS